MKRIFPIVCLAFPLFLACGGGKTSSPPPTQITVAGSSQTVPVGGTAAFTASVSGTTGAAVTWSVKEANSGFISSSGLYTAPLDTAGTFTIHVALQSDPTIATDAHVVVKGTPYLSVIDRDTTLDPSGNPYYMPEGQVCTVSDGVTLTLLPGVEFHGIINLMGTGLVQAVGTAANPIILANGSILSAAHAVETPETVFSHCQFRKFDLGGLALNGQISPRVGTAKLDHCSGSIGAISLGINGAITNSNLTITGFVAGTQSLLQGNVFTFPQPDQNLNIRKLICSFKAIQNNVFKVPAGTKPGKSLILVTNPEACPIIKGNSFLFNEAPAMIQCEVDPLFTSPTSPVAMDWSGNYWGTWNTYTVLAGIRDARTLPSLMTTLVVAPILVTPDPNTPAP